MSEVTWRRPSVGATTPSIQTYGEAGSRSEIQREVRRLEERISALENRVNSIEERLARLEGQMSLFVKLFIAFNLPILIAVIGILLKMVFS
jgi:uncharacterized protein (DUF342 family)